MSVSIERKLVLVDESDGTELTIEWDPDNDPPHFIIEADNLVSNKIRLYITPVDLLAFADLIKTTYGDHDPF